MIIDAIVTRALYVDASLPYLIVILLNDLSHPKNLSIALLILLYSSILYSLGLLPPIPRIHWYVRLYTHGL